MTIEAAATHTHTVALQSELLSTHFPPQGGARGHGVGGGVAAVVSGDARSMLECSPHSSASDGENTLGQKINTRILWRNTESMETEV